MSSMTSKINSFMLDVIASLEWKASSGQRGREALVGSGGALRRVGQ
jgi:hypothetical protein